MRILIVEDEFVIAADIAWVVENVVGFKVAGSAASIDEALAAISLGQMDGAVLDANLNGKSTERVANALAQKKFPFIVVSGVSTPDILPEPLRDAPFLRKPYYEEDLVQLILGLRN